MGKIATKVLAGGPGWSVGDVVCTSGPLDRPFEEQHGAVSIAVVVAGSFQYRSGCASEVMSPGAVLLGNPGQYFECGHEYGTGDRCVSFRYTPEFFEQAGTAAAFPVLRIPPMSELAPWVAQAGLGIRSPEKVTFEELAHGLVDAVLGVLRTDAKSNRTPSAADERRVSATLRFIEANLGEPLPLGRLAATAKMSEFHFLRAFTHVTGVTPHQYILRARLRAAAQRLIRCSDTVLEIALDVGFGDLSNFNHAFRAEFGASPRAYRSHPSLRCMSSK